MKIISWNVAGLRGILKKDHLINLIKSEDPDIICLQETKAEEKQVDLPKYIIEQYPFRFWESTKGTTQRKGLSGTCIWSKIKPIRQYNPPDTDEEGRITTVEFDNFIIMCVYTPNSQGLDSHRLTFRSIEWHKAFKEYISLLKQLKPTIICGDFNVAHKEIDIHHPKQHKKQAGFLDIERNQFQEYLDMGYVDKFRELNPNTEEKYTYWSQLNPKIRANNSGWRIDYFLCTEDLSVKDCEIWNKVYGSDHCPIYLELE